MDAKRLIQPLSFGLSGSGANVVAVGLDVVFLPRIVESLQKIFEREEPQAKIINLETAITRSDTHWQSKDVHYKMNPQNIPCLTMAGIDCCALANNHTLDWGISGLLDTLDTLDTSAQDACLRTGTKNL